LSWQLLYDANAQQQLLII